MQHEAPSFHVRDAVLSADISGSTTWVISGHYMDPQFKCLNGGFGLNKLELNQSKETY